MLRESDKVTEALIQLINAMPEREREKIAHSITKKKRKKDLRKTIILNGVTIIPADKKINVSALSDIFTGKGINPGKLRTEAWQRAK